MSGNEEYIVRYHHGGKLIREGGPIYENRKVESFSMDSNKICLWHLLGDVQLLCCDVNTTLKLLFVDGDGNSGKSLMTLTL